MSYQPKTYRDEGGDKIVVASGGVIDIESGGAFKIAGTQVTASAADLNTTTGLSGTTNTSFTVETDSATGKIRLLAVAGASDKQLTLQNTALTDNRVITFPDATGTVALSASASLTAGASGTAGTVTIYPATASNGTVVLSAADSVGGFNLTLVNAAQLQSTTLKIPDCGTAAGQFPLVTSDNAVLITATSPRTVTLGGNVSLAAGLTTAAAVTFTGAFAASFTVPSASTWVLPTGGGTLATSTGAETGTSNASFTVDSGSAAAKIALNSNSATGAFTLTLAPSNLSGNRTVSFQDSASQIVVARDTTDTLTNKTLTTPVINGATTAAAANNFTLHTGSGTFTTPTGNFTHYGNIASSGAITFDFSGSGGTFKTSTGANTLGGDVTISGTKAFTTGTGAVTIKGATTFDAGLDIAFAAGGDGSFSMAAQTGIFTTSTGTNTLSGDVVIANAKGITTGAGGGAGAFDFSGQTGAFTTSSGTNTLSGNVIISGDKTLTTGTGAAVLKGSATFDTTKTLTFGAAAGGTAIPITMYSLTTNKGAFILASTDNATNHAVTLTNGAANGAAATITTPNATCTLSGLGLAETFSGVKIFSAAPLITIADAATNSVTDLLTLTHTTSGTVAANFGVGVSFVMEDLGTASGEEHGSIDCVMDTVTDGAEDASFIFTQNLNGELCQTFKVDGKNQAVVIGQNVSDVDGIASLHIYPLTANQGKMVITSVANTGNTDLTITNAAQGGAYTYTIPNAGASKYFAMTSTAAGTVARADMTEEALATYRVGLMNCKNADGTVLTASAGAGVFGISNGGYGTGTLTLVSEGANNNTKTDTLCFEFALPPEYVATGDVVLHVMANYTGAGTVGTKTLDCECYELATAGTTAGDICATTIATLTVTNMTDIPFTITATDLVAGDKLLIFLRAIIQETATGGALTVAIGDIQMKCDIKG